MSKYDDILNIPRPISKKHKPMSIYNRAAQFAPFAALTGYEDVIEETGRTTSSELLLDEYQMEEINNQLLFLSANKNIEASYTYFVKDKYKKGGEYITKKGCLKKIIEDKNQIMLDTRDIINISDIVEIKH